MITLDHKGLFTNNYKRLAHFYKKLGFKKEKEETLSKSITKAIFGLSSDCIFIRLMSEKGIKIEIFEPVSIRLRKRTESSVGYNHLGYKTGDRRRFCLGLRKKKIKIIEVKRDNRIVYFIKDPDGNRIEIRD